MKFGIREICDVVLKAKAAQKIGNKIFYANEPVLYFDTLKSSSMEGASTTVYAQGGRGNTRLVAWEGERTVTFTMEDALISPEGFMILTGAGLIESGKDTPIYQHMTETVDKNSITDIVKDSLYKYDYELIENKSTATYYEIKHPYFTWGGETTDTTKPAETTGEDDSAIELTAEGQALFGTSAKKKFVKKGDELVVEIKATETQMIIPLEKVPYLPTNANGDYAYVMLVEDGEIISEPIIPEHKDGNTNKYIVVKAPHENYNEPVVEGEDRSSYTHTADVATWKTTYDSVIVDYYVEHTNVGAAKQIEISAESFGGNFYLEASTLFRDTNGSDLPAEFIIPNCKIQSNFNFSMASSGDPSTFTFTMDAFPDYTRFDRSKKVLAAIQILGADEKASMYRKSTLHSSDHDELLKSL